jgi:hypothetical protein
VSRYTYTASLEWGGDEPTAEVEVTLSYTVAWGSPETGRFGPPENYDSGSPDIVEDIKLELVEGKSRPWDMGYGYLPDDDFEQDVIEKLEAHEDDMLAEAREVEAGRAHDAAESRWEERQRGL